MKLRDNRDLALYAGIAAFSTAEHYVGTGQSPKAWEPFIGISLAVLIIIKGKLSKGDPDDPKPASGSWAVAKFAPAEPLPPAPAVDLEAVPVKPVV